MKNAAVAYHTMTGHSKRIAQAIGGALALPVSELSAVAGRIDLLFIAGGLYSGKSLPAMMDALDTLEPDKIGAVALLTSCASGKDPQKMVRDKLIRMGIRVLEQEFICPGGFLVFKRTHPDAQDMRSAVEFARETMASAL